MTSNASLSLSSIPSSLSSTRPLCDTVSADGGVEVIVDFANRPDGGLQVHAALFDEAGYLVRPLAVAQTAQTRLVFHGVPAGRYAVTAYADLNGNGRLDRNLFGAPTEPWGFSNDAVGRMASPRFAQAAFEVGETAVSLCISLRGGKVS